MAGARGEIEEERLLGVDRSQVTEELDGPIGQVGAQVVPVLDGSARPDSVVVVVEGRCELVCLAAVEPVPAVESATEGPRAPGARHVGLLLRAQVPLAHGIGRVPVGPEDLGQEAVLAWGPAPVPGESAGQIGDASHPAAVVVPSREQAGAGRGAEGRRVEVREPEAVGGQGVDDRGVDVGPVATELGESHVVEHDEHHVGRTVGWRGERRPPRLRGAPVVTDLAAELDPGHEGTSGDVGRFESIPPVSIGPARWGGHHGRARDAPVLFAAGSGTQPGRDRRRDPPDPGGVALVPGRRRRGQTSSTAKWRYRRCTPADGSRVPANISLTAPDKSGLSVQHDLLEMTHVHGGGLYFSAEDASEVLTSYADWAPSLPGSSTASIALLRLPPVPELPDAIRGRHVVHVRFASLDRGDAARLRSTRSEVWLSRCSTPSVTSHTASSVPSTAIHGTRWPW